MPVLRRIHGNYGRHFPGRRDVSRYADACVRNNGREAYRKVYALACRYPDDADRRQFLNAVLDHLLTFEDDYGMRFYDLVRGKLTR